MNKYSMRGNVEACHRNDKGFLYALVDLDNQADWDMIDHSEDKNFPVNNDIVYIGMTSNPIERFSMHRGKKSKKIGMVIFDKTETEFPHVELQAKENQAILNYCMAKGDYPKWQKGAKKFSGA